MTTLSTKSPKNPIKAELHFSRPLGSLGSTVSVMMQEVNPEHESIKYYLQMAKQKDVNVAIFWKQNMKKFPEFDWVKI